MSGWAKAWLATVAVATSLEAAAIRAGGPRKTLSGQVKTCLGPKGRPRWIAGALFWAWLTGHWFFPRSARK